MLYVRFSPSLRNMEVLLHERGVEISHESVLFWWNVLDAMFASDTRNRRFQQLHAVSNPLWHLDEVFVK